MLGLSFIVAASLLHTRSASESEAAQCRELAVSFLQTHSFVQSHSVPNDFFEDAAVVPIAVDHRTNYHAQAQRQFQAATPVVVPKFDVGSDAVPLPSWAIEDTRKMGISLALTQAAERRRADTSLALTQSAETSRPASTVGSRQPSGADDAKSIGGSAATSQPQSSSVPQETAQASAAKIAELEQVTQQLRNELQKVRATSEEHIKAEDLSRLEVLATEPPLAAEQPLAELQKSEDRYDAADRFVECQADAAGEDCMKARRHARHVAPSPFVQPVHHQQVQAKGVPDTTVGLRAALAQLSPRNDNLENAASVQQPAVEVERVQRLPSNLLRQRDSSAFSQLDTPQQRVEEGVQQMARQEIASNPPEVLPAEELERKAQLLEEQQQQLLYQVRTQQLMQLRHWEQQQQQKQWEQETHKERQSSQSPASWRASGNYDNDWLGKASVAELREYFNSKVASGRDVADKI
mmetsp:Transcript_26373/g.42302  ORF Transcript_26373/g.42302 Transcript_26373/m.42302 type:complete len:465 (-) Transcript_26373:144-1538(-)